MHYLITGHTGFKGAWLSIWLQSQGHSVSGISLDPITGSLYEVASVKDLVTNDMRIDIRDFSAVKEAITSTSPDVVIHMAAQPLVRESYKDPRTTFETNAMGTLNILESVSATPGIKAHLVITTDKVYRNVNQIAGYVEDDPLGGDDPYSASKAMADIATHSWITSFPGAPTAIARAGNVIGGGDVSPDRLLPDLINSFANGKSPVLRYPQAVRPWQHVLDCLNGYLMICDRLLMSEKMDEAFNIGPDQDSFVSVGEVATIVGDLWGSKSVWSHDVQENPHEAGLLALDATRAKSNLLWKNKLEFRDSIEWTVRWHKKFLSGEPALEISQKQLSAFLEIKGG
jgi:CDP-glucose 4,6-dehydratase